MKKTLSAAALLGVALASCAPTASTTPTVHEALLYGGSQERVVWVYGQPQTEAQHLRLGGQTVALRSQVTDPMAVAGSLSVDGKATYRAATQALKSPLALKLRDGYFDITQNDARGTVYYTNGDSWYKLNSNYGTRISSSAVPGLQGAGQLTDAEAAAISQALLHQGPLAVTVLNEQTVPDGSLAMEPVSADYKRTALYVLPKVQTVSAPSTVTLPSSNPVRPQGYQVNVQRLASGNNAAVGTPTVKVARTGSEVAELYRLAYGRQSGMPALPRLESGESLIGLFVGQRSTGGYGIQVASSALQGNTLVLSVNLTSPGPGTITTQALTSPWIIVKAGGAFEGVSVVDTQGRPFGGN